MELRNRIAIVLDKDLPYEFEELLKMADKIIEVLPPQSQIMSEREIVTIVDSAYLEWENNHQGFLTPITLIASALSGKIASFHSELDLTILAEQNKEIERLRVQLAGCGVAALGYATGKNAVKKGDRAWSASFQDVEDLWNKYAALLKLHHSPKELPRLPEKLGDESLWEFKGFKACNEKVIETINALLLWAKSVDERMRKADER